MTNFGDGLLDEVIIASVFGRVDPRTRLRRVKEETNTCLGVGGSPGRHTFTAPLELQQRQKLLELNLVLMRDVSSPSPDEDRECSAGVVSQRGSGPSGCRQDLPLRQTGVLDR